MAIAPEAGSERLRRVINKDISEEAYLEGLHALFQEGWESLKLYFMIGLPTETEEDLEGIVRMARLPLQVARKEKVRKVNVNVSVSTFVPKPHTPFQWQGQIPLSDIHRKQVELRKRLAHRNIRFKTHQPEMSLLEGIFSRGDESTSRLLLSAFRKGCRFDGWTDALRYDLWEEAMDETGVGPGLAERTYDASEALPWRMIDPGVRTGFLKKELELSVKGQVSPECREQCTGCGLKCESAPGLAVEECVKDRPQAGSRTTLLPQATPFRIRYKKVGMSRFLSHLELKESFIRGLRRSGIVLDYSQGFHPHPKISFGPALSVGFAGLDEYLDIQVLSPLIPEHAPTLLNPCLPGGLEVLALNPILVRAPSLNEFISRFEYRVELPPGLVVPAPPVNQDLPFERIAEDGKVRVVNLAPLIDEVRQEDSRLTIIAQDRGDLKVRLNEILSVVLGIPYGALPVMSVERARQQGFLNGWVSPMDVIG